MDAVDHFKNRACVGSLKRVFLMACLLLAAGAMYGQKLEWALEDTKQGSSFHEGIASFEEDRKYGAIDHSGKVVIEPQFKFGFEFNDGFAVVATESGYGIINRSGMFILEPTYKRITKGLEAEGLYVVVNYANQGLIFYQHPIIVTIYNNKEKPNFISFHKQNNRSNTY